MPQVVATSIAAVILSVLAVALFLIGSQESKDHEEGTQETNQGVLVSAHPALTQGNHSECDAVGSDYPGLLGVQ